MGMAFRALGGVMAEVEHEAHADGLAPQDLAAVSARWAQVRDQSGAFMNS
jgi:hypothetical protein